ncbi:MAG: family 10 glycosylhydrolase [Planctomycetaceae bacterium]|nr:family 10 glycosylhydrolase [Planctomycetaceae bacterium]
MFRRSLMLVTFAFLTSNIQAQNAIPDPPPAPREFRAAWVATVDNIDWPSKRGLSTDEQQAELLRILETASRLKLNCLVLQVRTTADALYDSTLEPWSYYLTGESGKAPSPYYDPLTMWVEEAHRRGIEIHAWLNPYRARFGNNEVADLHISKTRPDLVKPYGRYLWLDPGEPDAATHSLAVFADVVKRYDIDGVHMDDYFYPYPITEDGKEVDFPDDPSWSKYQQSGGTLSRPDWRRDNVNRLVQKIHQQTRSAKPWVRFGISPFGIGRPGAAPGITGFDQYEKLYADATLWLKEGWCDYFSPQLYWPIEQKAQSFPVLYDFWRKESTANVPVWPGLFTSRTGDKSRPFPPQEIQRQIETVRLAGDATGHIHFSMKALMQNREGLAEDLEKTLYANSALVPEDLKAAGNRPVAPVVARSNDSGDVITIRPGNEDALKVFAIWNWNGKEWKFDVIPATQAEYKLPEGVQRVVITAVDRFGRESDRVATDR